MDPLVAQSALTTSARSAAVDDDRNGTHSSCPYQATPYAAMWWDAYYAEKRSLTGEASA